MTWSQSLYNRVQIVLKDAVAHLNELVSMVVKLFGKSGNSEVIRTAQKYHHKPAGLKNFFLQSSAIKHPQHFFHTFSSYLSVMYLNVDVVLCVINVLSKLQMEKTNTQQMFHRQFMITTRLIVLGRDHFKKVRGGKLNCS